MTRFRIKTFDAEAVVFDTESGDTHYLQPLTLAVYLTCRDAPCRSAEQIGETLAARLSTPLTPALLALADEALASLRRIGLLHPA